MKKLILLLWLSLAALACAACSQQPPAALISDPSPDAQAISAEPESGAETQFSATLYFRYGDTALLRQETRLITLPPNETREKALVCALLDGSREAGGGTLFPEKTEVLSTQAQGNILYVTFNEALYGRYADESRAGGDSALRRSLAMAALAATLTESGEYRGVQVLVRAEENVGRSMRLRNSFFGLEDDAPAPVLTRRQESLPTPAAYARALLTAWQTRDPAALAPLLAQRGGLAAQGGMEETLAASPVLTAFTVYEGTVAPDGGSAVVCADLTLRGPDGAEREIAAYPLRLLREDGAWKAVPAQAAAMMENADD